MTVFDYPEFKILSSPVRQLIPTIDLRVDFSTSGKSLAYSCDIEPCKEVVHLAEGANVLIHEATGASLGHSSASQAGEVASQTAAGRLYLIHYPMGEYTNDRLIAEVRQYYQGEVKLATDFLSLDFS